MWAIMNFKTKYRDRAKIAREGKKLQFCLVSHYLPVFLMEINPPVSGL